MNKHILALSEIKKNDFDKLFVRALELKKRHKHGIKDLLLTGKTLGLIFNKPSTRTRLSFETAMAQLGGTSLFISTQDTQMSRNEPVKDTARVLSRYLDCVAVRTYEQEFIEEFAAYSTIPVINALTDLYHPCQVLSDILTVIEFKKSYKDIKIAWVGDGNNVAHSWLNAAAELSLNLVLACPEAYLPDQNITKKAQEKCSTVHVVSDPEKAVHNADVIYTDVWSSMGHEDEHESRKQLFEPFQVNSTLVGKASENVIVMHCLPAHRGEEISEEVFEGPHSVVWEQSENKLHMHKAILEMLIT